MNMLNRQVSMYAGPDDDGADNNDSVETPKKVAAAIKKAMHDMQLKNEQRLEEIEKGINDGITKEELEKLNTHITDLQAMADENSRNVARMTLGGDVGDSQKERIHAARFLSMATKQKVRPGDSALDIDGYRNYCEAFEALVRSECVLDAMSSEFRAALSVGSDRDGGYFVPDEMSAEIERRVHDTSAMRGIARTITIGRSAWEAPYKSSKGVSGGWVGEKESRPSTGTGGVGMQRISVHDQYAYPEVTQDMLEDSTLNVESFIVEDTEDEMGRTENTAFVSGNGVMKPRGFLDYKDTAVATADSGRDWGVLEQVVTGAAAGFPTLSSGADDPGALIDAIAALNPAYRQGAVWTMNRKTEAEVRKLKDSQGRYLVGFGDIREGVTGFNIHGFPITNFEDMPNIAANSYSIAFGNFRRGYFIIDRAGFRMLRDPFTNKPYVGFYITKRVGGDVRNYDAIKLIKTSA